MVLSRIDKSISYNGDSSKQLDTNDIGYDASLYEVEIIPGIESIIALGKVKYTYIDKGVLYIPVYLVVGDSVVAQIGVYEFLGQQYTNLLDEDNDFDISRLEDQLPLLYSYVTPSFIRKHLSKTKPIVDTTSPSALVDDVVDDVVDDEDVPEKDGGNYVDTDKWSTPNKPTVLEELTGDKDTTTMDEAIEERKMYVPSAQHNWMQRFYA